MSRNYIVAIDVETTGLKPRWHEITQLGCILVTPWIEIDPKYRVLSLDISPNYPERIEEMALKAQKEINPTYDRNKYLLTKKDLINRLTYGLQSDKAADVFIDWYEKLKLPPGSRLVPLAHNWVFDRQFIDDWLGEATFDMIFDARYRCTLSTAGFINDKARFHSEGDVFMRSTLGDLAKQMGYVTEYAHNALDDCRTLIEVYRRLMTNTYLGQQI